MLKIRPYVKGSDEEIYLQIFNACFNDYDDNRRMTIDELRKIQTAPNYSSEGLMIAEWNGEAAGMIDAFVDLPREEPKGFVQSLSVLPEFRGRGIAKALLKEALESLGERGMKVAMTWAQTDRESCVRLYKSFGFREIRAFSMMKASLTSLPSDVGENRSAVIRSAKLDRDEDVRLLNRLDNESFKEHFNFRPRTVDETRHTLFEMPWFKGQRWFFAEEDRMPVGYVGTGIDVGLNKEKNLRWGWILDIGVLKPWRRQGIGARLILNGMRVLKDAGMEDALLYVDDMNPTKAIRLYKKVGFKVARKNLTLELRLHRS